MINRNYILHIFKQHRVINFDNSLCRKFNKTLTNNPSLMQLLINSTSFLRVNACKKTRLHVLIQGINEQPICVTCGRDVSMRLSGKYRYTFPSYCRSACFSGSVEVQAKRRSTNFERYGAITFTSTPTGIAKIKQTKEYYKTVRSSSVNNNL